MRKLLVVCMLVALAGVASLGYLGSDGVSRAATAATTVDPVLVGAGDIASCGERGDSRTARLLDSTPGTVFTTGDNAYDSGTAAQFRNCYDPTWGRHKARTRPSPGNHDYKTPGAAPYYRYFGANAGPTGRGYYSYDLGEGQGRWHVISLNSNKAAGPGSTQYEWLRDDLAANPGACTVAYWHHPVFSSGEHGNSSRMTEIWKLLDEAGVDVVLAGHDHDYERFAPQTAGGEADSNGIRQFVVGTGGRFLRPFGNVQTNSEARNAEAQGVLKLSLRAGSYDWEFVPVAGATYSDSGSAACVTL